MKMFDWISNSGLELSKLSLNAHILQAEFQLEKRDKEAAWELYIELLTRITTQPLPADVGDDKTALTSVYSLFPITREILKDKGSGSIQFAKIAIPVLNQVIRPFTAKWHKLSLEGAFSDEAQVLEFRCELEELQEKLCGYAKALSMMAGVEDLTQLEDI